MPDLSALRTTLSAPLNTVLDQHRAEIVRKFSGTGDFSQSFLANEELVRQVAGYSYDFLPWPVRMAVKKPVFIDFVAAHRVNVLARLVPAQTI
jgi:hypothetical protein